jgi:hypothetical protein
LSTAAVTVFKWNKETGRFDIPRIIPYSKSGGGPSRPYRTGRASPSLKGRPANKKPTSHERRDRF